MASNKEKKSKTKSIIRKLIYLVLFALIIFALIYLSEKYADLSKRKEMTFNDYYTEIAKTDCYNVIKADELIKKLKSGKHLIFIGSNTSVWSNKYAEVLTDIFIEENIHDINYFNLNNDKSQKNSNYYEIKEILKGSLTSTDGSESNLLAPSFYILDNGKVKYYNIDTVAMKNTIKPEDYWTAEKVNAFKTEVINAINKYYLNN